MSKMRSLEMLKEEEEEEEMSAPCLTLSECG
jgi:hypothetical protein